MALRLAETAATRFPDKPELQTALAEALIENGRAADARKCLAAALEAFPRNQGLRAKSAWLFGFDGEIETALALIEGSRGEPWAAIMGLRLLTKHGRHDEAAEYARAVEAIDPSNAGLTEWHAWRLRDDPAAMLCACDAALALAPGATNAIFHKAVSLARLGRSQEAGELMAIERLVRRLSLPKMEGWATRQSYLDSLSREIVGNPTLHADPAGHASRGGLRTRTFPHADDPASEALLVQIRSAVADYATALDGEPHPFAGSRPARATLSAWALIFRGMGHQAVHYHPEPWMTGVFYARSPAGCAGGALRVGSLPKWAAVKPPWPVIDVVPEPGTLVLFPSFIPHCTVPTASNEDRISVAFDVNPAD